MIRPALRVIAVALGLTVLATTAWADSWRLYGTRVSVSPNGRHYVVVDGSAFTGGCGRRPSTVHLVERRSDRQPVESRTVYADDLPPAGPLGLVEAGDRLVASVRLEQLPYRCDVLDDGRVVLLDSYGSLGYAQLVIVLDRSGAVTHSLSPDAVFPGFADRFSGSVSSKHWCAASWIEEGREELVLLATDRSVRVVDVVTGVVSDRDRAEALFSPTGAQSEEDRQRVWELVYEEQTPGGLEAARIAAADESLPLSVRVRAATTVGSADRDAVRELFLRAIEDSDEDVSRWAWMHLGLVLGAEACPYYRQALARAEVGVPAAAGHLIDGMAMIGDEAIEPAVEMLLEPAASESSDWLGARVVFKLQHDFAATKKYPWCYDPSQERALISLRDTGDLESLDTLFESRTYETKNVHGFLALPALVLLQRRPQREAAPAVASFLALLHEKPYYIARWDERLRAAAVQALRACTGLQLGDDPAAWQAALGG